MFERFDEPARRALFFARYEASRLGARSIDREHMLLGLLRESKGEAAKLLSPLPLVGIRKDLEGSQPAPAAVPVEVEIPFSADTKRALEYAAQEADGLVHRYIGTEHLLLRLLREGESPVAAMLARHGLRLDGARERLREGSSVGRAKGAQNQAARERIEQIMKLTTELSSTFSGNPEIALRIDLLLLDLKALESLIDEQP